MQQAVIEAFHRTAFTARSQIFDDDRLMPVTALEDANTPAPGWVGKDWMPGGLLMVAINPGGGGDGYRRNPTDEELYANLRRFRDASAAEREQSLMTASECWMRVQRSHNIYRLMEAIFAAARVTDRQTAFLNILPFRTRGDKPARALELRRAWAVATGKQVEALNPARIIALGAKAFNALQAVGATEQFDSVLLKRAIGDSYITPQAQEALRSLKPRT